MSDEKQIQTVRIAVAIDEQGYYWAQSAGRATNDNADAMLSRLCREIGVTGLNLAGYIVTAPLALPGPRVVEGAPGVIRKTWGGHEASEVAGLCEMLARAYRRGERVSTDETIAILSRAIDCIGDLYVALGGEV